MANVHCFGVGLVGSYVAVKLSQSGHSIHAYDPQPFRVVGLPGVEVHHLEEDDEPIDLMLDMIAQQKSFEFDPDVYSWENKKTGKRFFGGKSNN